MKTKSGPSAFQFPVSFRQWQFIETRVFALIDVTDTILNLIQLSTWTPIPFLVQCYVLHVDR